MTTFFSLYFLLLVGLVFPVIAMAYLFLHVPKKKKKTDEVKKSTTYFGFIIA